MSLEIYHLPPHSEEVREKLLSRALETINGPDYSSIFHVAPTQAIARSLKKEFHRAAIRIGEQQCYIPPQISTLRQLALSLCTASGDKIIVNSELIPVIISGLTACPQGLAVIVAELIRDLKLQFPFNTPEEMGGILKDTFEEAGTPEEASRRAQEALEMMHSYQDAIETAGAMDEYDALSEASRLTTGLPNIRLLFLDGFYEISPAEEALIMALIDRAEEALAVIPISGPDDDLSYCYSKSLSKHYDVKPELVDTGAEKPILTHYAAPSMEEEIENIARDIKSSFISGRMRDLDSIVIAFPKLGQYRDMTGRVLRKYGIPCHIPPKQLSKTRPYLDLLALLEAAGEGYPRVAFSQALCSRYFKKIPPALREIAPRISLDSGLIKGKAAWMRAFKEHRLGRAGNYVFSITDKFESTLNLGSYGLFANVVLDITRAFGFIPPEGSVSDFETVLKRLSMLDDIMSKPPDLKTALEALKRMLDANTPDRDARGVRVVGLNEIRGLEPRSLYLGGLKDGDLPSRPDMDFILSDGVRKRLGLLDLKRYLHLQHYIFKRLIASAGNLYLSYPAMEGDKFYLPSVFLSGSMEVSRKPFGVFSREELMLRMPAPPLAKQIEEIMGVWRFSSRSAIRVTDVDAYRTCPRKFFVERILKLSPPEITEYELEATALGSILHEVMERLLRKNPAGYEGFIENAAQAMDEVLPSWPVDAYFKKLIRQSFMDALPEMYVLEGKIRDDGYSFDKAELELAGEPVQGISLKGKVDRVDRKEGAVQVIDYKTGAVSLVGSQTLKRGENLQLFLYAALLRAEGLVPERVGIYSLKDIRLKFVPGPRDIKRGKGIDDFIASALSWLKLTASEMREGRFQARPLSDQTCRNCPEKPYCPYILRIGGKGESDGD